MHVCHPFSYHDGCAHNDVQSWFSASDETVARPMLLQEDPFRHGALQAGSCQHPLLLALAT